MAYQALYRKYRPETFSDVVGQEHITETLKKEIGGGKIVHAYLFTGTRGTGKTSCAKILSKAVNCLNPQNGDPCGECDMCRAIANGEITDIVEIDAASNNGVDNIRDLREQVTFAPVNAKYRVYIIDEVHMLSIGAFNALLKTLEEPPEHVVFILATTEVHKLPATILSRCQRFDFRRIDAEKICSRLNFVAQNEGFSLTGEAASLIASVADGGMRDALSVLDLCASKNSQITEETVASVCAMAGNEYLIKLADHIRNRNTEGALLLLDELHNSSIDMLRLLSELINHYRDLMIVKTVKSDKKPIVCSSNKLALLTEQSQKYDIKEIMAILGILQEATAPMQNGNMRCEMEMTLIRLCNPEIRNDASSLEMRIAALESGIKPVKKSTTSPKTEPASQHVLRSQVTPPAAEETPEEIPLPAEPTVNTAATDGACEKTDAWDDILSVLKITCPIIAGVLQGSSAYLTEDRLLIDTQNSQFRSLVNGADSRYRDAIRNAALKVLGKNYKLGPYNKASTETAIEQDPLAAFAQKLKELEQN